MSAFERSIAIHILNAIPNTTLVFNSPTASSGPLPTASSPSIGTGATMVVSAENDSGGCIGSFVLTGGGALFTVSYDHPVTSGPTTVAVAASAGYVWGTDAATYAGHDVTTQLHLYQGVPANDFGGYAVPLGLLDAAPVNNCQDFANSMFGPNMRAASQVEAAYSNPIEAGYIKPADFTGGQLDGFVAIWTSQWINGSDPRCPPADAALIALLASYMKTATSAGPLSMWLPQLAYRAGTSPSVFALSGYKHLAFLSGDGSWDVSTVNTFLTLLAAGAHFVSISATDDLPVGVSMQSFDDVFNNAGLPISKDPGSSHYASTVNITGTYYLDISEDFAPPDGGLILAFLVGRTVNRSFPSAGSYNTFIQLEGWQAPSDRHSVDYDTYKATLWNISTYGACPYSEKRATTIFLAPPGWSPQVYQTTRMMPYVGAYATDPSHPRPQPWLNTALVEIPTTAPALPLRYFT
ncbi:MAG TPA: hypothetical protein VNP04_32000 [Alphaproteobacteria bacterium]|nr:hypothetical protein [Alphaproteobacteria bacterium]